jgi:hypothetical protein
MLSSISSIASRPLALLFLCLIGLPALAHSLSALWPAARYAGGFIGEPLVDNEFESE